MYDASFTDKQYWFFDIYDFIKFKWKLFNENDFCTWLFYCHNNEEGKKDNTNIREKLLQTMPEQI